MQARKAAELRADWKRDHAGEECSHPSFDKEYDLGASTGDYICTTCGECFMGEEYREIRAARRKA